MLLELPPFPEDGRTTADVFRDASLDGIESIVLMGSGEEFLNQQINDAIGPVVDESNKLSVPGGMQNLTSVTELLKKIICGGKRSIAWSVNPMTIK